MPVLRTPPTYDNRTVKEWLTMAGRGEVVLPNFQRSFVWKPQQTSEYIRALLESRPTGIFLILKATHPLQFESRSLQGISFQAEQCRELVLDGQQRLTSLWGALNGKAKPRYFIGVRNLREGDLEVEEVVGRSPSWSNPVKMHQENWIPVDILWNDPNSSQASNPGPSSSDSIKGWCQQAAGDEWEPLFDAVTEIRERLLLNAKLQYCRLDDDTDPDTAIDIFINVNRSAIKLKQVDIAVAIARANHGEDLRARVNGYLDRSTEAPFYFNSVRSRAIPAIAAWILKVGCLKIRTEKHPEGLPPKESHYPSAVKSLFGSDVDNPEIGAKERDLKMRQLEADLDHALWFVAQRGGATKRTLPAWPPVHVIAALQDDVRRTGAVLADEVDRLLSAYVWRAFVTSRYHTQANDRLLEDYRALRQYLRALTMWDKYGGDRPGLAAPAFDKGRYPLPSSTQVEQAGWIGSASRLGRAIAAVAMQGSPFDWLTDEKLDPRRVRDLEHKGKLDRHYVFPPTVFAGTVEPRLKLGLNGVLLAKASPTLMKRDPNDLMTSIRERQPGLDEMDLQRRVGSHHVPYWALVRDGTTVSLRYEQFIKTRATKVAQKIKGLASF